jgi:Family of unknown function (DUF5681)
LLTTVRDASVAGLLTAGGKYAKINDRVVQDIARQLVSDDPQVYQRAIGAVAKNPTPDEADPRGRRFADCRCRSRGKAVTTSPKRITDKTVPKQLTPWKPGESGNLAGRPKGSRNKLGEQFLADLYAFWETAGPTVIQAAAYDNPAAFVKVMAMILPQELKLGLDDRLADMTDNQLERREFGRKGYWAVYHQVSGYPRGKCELAMNGCA